MLITCTRPQAPAIIEVASRSRANCFSRRWYMNMIGEFAKRIIGELAQFVDWSLSNWTVTMIVFIVMIYWAGRQQRLNRHHL